MHVVEQLAGEKSVLRRRDEGSHLCGCPRKQDGKKDSLHFPVFLIGTSVVGQSVMVEGFAERVAPMAVFGTDGGGDGVRFGFADESCSVGVHDILQNAGAAVVARDKKHFVGRHLRCFCIDTLFAQQLIVFLFFPIGFHFFVHLLANFVMNRFHEQADK